MKTRLLNCVCLLVALTVVQTVNAETIKISDPKELSGLKSLKPGDKVVIAPGVYRSCNMKFSASGTESSPITLESSNPGEVIFTGTSTLQVSGKYVVVKNLYFKDIVPVKGIKSSLIEFRTNDSGLQNCVISGINTEENKEDDSKWVSLYGERNCVERCTFIDKKNIGCLLVVWLEGGITPRHRILNNYFTRPTVLRDPDGSKKNGQECIRIGTSDYSMNRAECLVEGNTFYRCDSEIEVISNKSCYNKFINNLFLETQGALTLRHGNNSLVEGNFFIGNGREGTAGIRVIGDHQTVRNNYFENGMGKNYMAAICLIQGVVNSPLNRYFQVKETKIEGNIIKNCYNGIVVSYGNSPDQSLPVISTEIAGNIIYNDNDQNYSLVWIDTPGKPDVTFRDNIIYGGQVKNIGEDILRKTDQKPAIEDMSDKWKKIKDNSGACWIPDTGKRSSKKASNK